MLFLHESGHNAMKQVKYFILPLICSLITSSVYFFFQGRNEIYYNLELRTNDGSVTESNLSYRNRFSYRNSDNKIVVVNKGRRLLEIAFDDKMRCSSLDYFYEFNGKLFKEKYASIDNQLCMVKRSEIPKESLSGSARFNAEKLDINFTITKREIVGFTPTKDLCNCK
jgi:hypothetical protein